VDPPERAHDGAELFKRSGIRMMTIDTYSSIEKIRAELACVNEPLKYRRSSSGSQLLSAWTMELGPNCIRCNFAISNFRLSISLFFSMTNVLQGVVAVIVQEQGNPGSLH
jgi:hypothetical protein